MKLGRGSGQSALILARCRRNKPFKGPLEVRLVGEPRGESNIRQRTAGAELRAAKLDPAVELIGMWGESVRLFECPDEVRGGKTDLRADGLEAEGARAVVPNEISGPREAVSCCGRR